MKNILIPIDITDGAKGSVKFAIKLSVRSNSKLFFYYVSESSTSDIKAECYDFVKQNFSEINVDINTIDTEIVTANDVISNHSIKKITIEYSIDLVVLSVHYSGFYKTFFDSRLSELINKINCPVFTIPQTYRYSNIYRIGFASELFDLKRRIKMIVPFAKLFDATVEVFHVYPIFPQIIDVAKINKEKEICRIRKENKYENINFCFIRTDYENESDKGIFKYITANKPNLLVMSVKSNGFFDKLDPEIAAITSSVPILAYNKKSTSKLI